MVRSAKIPSSTIRSLVATCNDLNRSWPIPALIASSKTWPHPIPRSGMEGGKVSFLVNGPLDSRPAKRKPPLRSRSWLTRTDQSPQKPGEKAQTGKRLLKDVGRTHRPQFFGVVLSGVSTDETKPHAWVDVLESGQRVDRAFETEPFSRVEGGPSGVARRGGPGVGGVYVLTCQGASDVPGPRCMR